MALVCDKSTLQIIHMVLVCDFITIQIVLMALIPLVLMALVIMKKFDPNSTPYTWLIFVKMTRKKMFQIVATWLQFSIEE